VFVFLVAATEGAKSVTSYGKNGKMLTEKSKMNTSKDVAKPQSLFYL
jgi:hypothetical protein